MMTFDFDNPTRLIFGSGKLNELGSFEMPGKKAEVLISNGKSTRVNGYLDRTLEQLDKAGVEYVIFDKIMENPDKEVVMEGAAFAKDNACDFIVALGGGAVLDASTAIAAMATNPGDFWDYVGGGSGKGMAIEQKGLPVVAITTTAGTGSEINCWGVISNRETQEKVSFGDSKLYPVLAIVDPELMLTVPKNYTAYQGFDALFHHTEVMLCTELNVMSEALALSSIEHIAKYLPTAVNDGSNLKAREHVAYGSTLAGMTMQLTSEISAHGMEHSMSAYHPNLPHGAGLIMIAKEFYEFFVKKHACDDRFIKMAKAMGIAKADKPEDFITALVKLQEDCGVADLRMSDYGIEADESMKIAKGAFFMEGELFELNPCEMTVEECAEILEKSFR